MKTISKLWRGIKGVSPERNCFTLSDLRVEENLGDPLIKKLDYKMM
ncbi:MAG: hypothetical protein R3359_10895 [Marinirhabdus sp.]|nr:hypothetical protein [Marinirhabdus sp.]